MRFRTALFATLFLLGGCTTARDMYFPDGSLGHHITCNGVSQGYGDCMQKAGEICGARGYELLGQMGETHPMMNAESGSVEKWGKRGGQAQTYSRQSNTPAVTRDVFVKCK